LQNLRHVRQPAAGQAGRLGALEDAGRLYHRQPLLRARRERPRGRRAASAASSRCSPATFTRSPRRRARAPILDCG